MFDEGDQYLESVGASYRQRFEVFRDEIMGSIQAFNNNKRKIFNEHFS